MLHTVVLIRHGESIWNQEERFTGWADVPLTPNGENDALDAGRLLGERKITFDVAFTSHLERAWRTCAIALAESQQSGVEVIRSSKLNERHYGALQGHLKNCPNLEQAFGEKKLLEWRRSFHTAPPDLYDMEILKKIGPDSLMTCTEHLHQRYIDVEKFENARRELKTEQQYFYNSDQTNDDEDGGIYPSTESLQQCQQRAYGYWKDVILPRVKQGDRVLVVAHANTIRALVKAVDNIDDADIAYLKIPNGIPLVYTFDENLQPNLDMPDDIGFNGKYLVSSENHGKMMAYERCVRKKMRNLFEYLDTDHDGQITSDCLLQGLSKLHTVQFAPPPTLPLDQLYNGSEDSEVMEDLQDPFAKMKEKRLYADICEYEVEELLRCVPKDNDEGFISLQNFLDHEVSLLPKLSKLRLLQ